MKSVSFFLLLFFCLSLSAVARNDFQITIGEHAANLMLEKVLAMPGLKNPKATFKNNEFEFEGSFKIIVNIHMRYVGIARIENGNIALDVREFYQNGKLQSDKVTVSRINLIIKAFNEYSTEKLQGKVLASFQKPVSCPAGILFDMTNCPLITAKPQLKLKSIVLEDQFVTVSSSEKNLVNNQSDLQVYLGNDVLNGICGGIISNVTSEAFTVTQMNVSLNTNPVISMKYSKNSGSFKNSLKLTTRFNLPDPALLELQITSHQSEKTIDFDSEMAQIASVLTTPSAPVIKVLFSNPEFVYLPEKDTFQLDFSKSFPPGLQAGLLEVKAVKDQISVSGTINAAW